MRPKHCHPDDARWIREQLQRLPAAQRIRARDGYSAAYQAAHDAEPLGHKKDNRARFAANTRLREFLKKVH